MTANLWVTLFDLKIYVFIGCAGSLLLGRLSLLAMSRGYTLIVVCGLLTLVAFLVAEPLGAWAQ